MAKSDTVMVQPLTSYMEGAETKHSHSPAYEVERPHAVELTANGFARMLDGSAHDDEGSEASALPAAEDQRVDGATEGKIENDGKPRGRRALPRD
ncbi:hypothetical protein [Methylobacterium sp. Leaf108]|uniref:hypothetical protein n=1 Tax=Methylobacterium sp. Leaf108 TaxID=1736256 RepID=UPI0012E83B86|nr:hypothetical protein [Methylobacterium sp. Leaf108]